jgi:hypothetical protein
MADVTVKFFPTMKYMLQGPNGLVDRDMRRRALIVQSAAQARAGVRTGALKKSIHTRRNTRSGGGFQYEVGSEKNYALIHHEGAAPHLIVANRAQSLRFTAGGRVVYTRQVSHPGFRANRYLKDSLRLALI